MLLDRGMMGDGVADLNAIRAAVKGAGYTGPSEVEIFLL
jgi:sugar phosphate isomerase/epimerase